MNTYTLGNPHWVNRLMENERVPFFQNDRFWRLHKYYVNDMLQGVIYERPVDGAIFQCHIHSEVIPDDQGVYATLDAAKAHIENLVTLLALAGMARTDPDPLRIHKRG